MPDEHKRPIYYYSIAEDPILILQAIREHHSESTYRTDQKGEGQLDKTVVSQTCVVDPTTENIMPSIGQNIPFIYP